MHPRVRTIIIWALVVFALYAIVTSPQETADALKGVWNVIYTAVHSIATFFHSLLAHGATANPSRGV